MFWWDTAASLLHYLLIVTYCWNQEWVYSFSSEKVINTKRRNFTRHWLSRIETEQTQRCITCTVTSSVRTSVCRFLCPSVTHWLFCVWHLSLPLSLSLENFDSNPGFHSLDQSILQKFVTKLKGSRFPFMVWENISLACIKDHLFPTLIGLLNTFHFMSVNRIRILYVLHGIAYLT